MNFRFLLFLILSFPVHAEKAPELDLSDHGRKLSAPEGWVIKKQDGQLSLYSPDQPAQGMQRRIHFVKLCNQEESLEAAINAEIDAITEKSPMSSNARNNYKGSIPIKTLSGTRGFKADFYTVQNKDGISEKSYQIVKYYFYDSQNEIFKICAHVYGNEAKAAEFEKIIIETLSIEKAPQKSQSDSTK